MGQLLSTNFYLEWSAMYDARANESLRSGREYLIWPAADAESDDEDEEDRPVLKASFLYPFPSFASHKRKLALFELIQYLHIDEIPSRSACEELKMTLRAGGRVLSPVKRLSLGAKAYWSIVDWEDRHPGLVHPFIAVITQCQPKHLCITYPTCDSDLEERYMLPRTVTNAEHLSRQESVDQYTFLRIALQTLVKERFATPLRCLATECQRLRSITVHNASDQALPRLEGVAHRVFLHPCSCSDSGIVAPVAACYDHWRTTFNESDEEVIYRASTDQFVSLSRATGTAEFVDYHWVQGELDHDCARECPWDACDEDVDREFWRRFADRFSIEQTEEARKAVSFTLSREAESCVCCGKKQLTYAEVSTGSRLVQVMNRAAYRAPSADVDVEDH